ncbi:unnamed protein product, partial [Notodromas monacha]
CRTSEVPTMKLLNPTCPPWYTPQAISVNDAGILAFAGRDAIFFYAWKDLILNFVAVQRQAHGTENVLAVVAAKGVSSGNKFCSLGSDGSIKAWLLSDHLVNSGEEVSQNQSNDFEELDKSSDALPSSKKKNTWSVTQVASHLLHAKSKKAEVLSLDFTSDSKWIVSVDSLGTVVSFRVVDNHFVEFPKLVPRPALVSCSPMDTSLVAFGCKAGLVMLVRLRGAGEIVHRLRRHDSDVTGLLWHPDGKYLVSSARESVVYVWNSETGESVGSVCGEVDKKSAETSSGSTIKRPWLQTAWIAPERLVVSGLGNRIRSFRWLNNPSEEGNQQSLTEDKSLGEAHAGNIQSLAASVLAPLLVSVGQDRMMCAWSGDDLSAPKWRQTTVAGFVNCVALAPDGRTVAVGCGDAGIRVYTVPFAGQRVINLSNKVAGRVTALDWFPRALRIDQGTKADEEPWLAYGTEEGRIGIFKSFHHSGKKQPTPQVSPFYHKKTVYSVKWTPALWSSRKQQSIVIDDRGKNTGVELEAAFSLLSCGDGVVHVHAPDLKTVGVDFDKAFGDNAEGSDTAKIVRSAFTVKDDMKMMALGNMDGSVEVYSCPEVSKLWLIVCQPVAVMSIAFHPSHTRFCDSNGEKFKNLLAFGTNKSKVCVVECPEVAPPTTTTDVRTIGQATCILKGHSGRIPDICWSPNKSGKLYSGGYDGAIRCWCLLNGCSGERKSDFVLKPAVKQERVFTVCVVPAQKEDATEEYFLHGGDMCCLFQSSETDMEAVIERQVEVVEAQEKITRGNRCLDSRITANGEALKSSSEAGDVKVEVQQPESASYDFHRAPVEDTFSEKSSSVSHRLEESVSSDQVPSASARACDKNRQKSLLSWTRRMDNAPTASVLKEVNYLFNRVRGVDEQCKEEESYPQLGIFLGEKETENQLSYENSTTAAGMTRLSHAVDCGVYSGDLMPVFKKAIEDGTVTEQMLALAPMHSWAIWKDLTEAYARQCEKNGRFRQASVSRVAIGDTEGAIRALLASGKFHDALALARLRRKDATIDVILKEWLDFSRNASGSQQMAAKCSLASGDFMSAGRALAAKAEKGFLALAAKIMAASSNQDESSVREADLTALKAIGMLTEGGEIDEALELVKCFPRWSWMRPVLLVEQLLLSWKPSLLDVLESLSLACDLSFVRRERQSSDAILLGLNEVLNTFTVSDLECSWQNAKSHFALSTTRLVGARGVALAILAGKSKASNGELVDMCRGLSVSDYHPVCRVLYDVISGFAKPLCAKFLCQFTNSLRIEDQVVKANEGEILRFVAGLRLGFNIEPCDGSDSIYTYFRVSLNKMNSGVSRVAFSVLSGFSRRGFQTSTCAREIFTVQDSDDFEKKVIQSPKPVIVDFYADWCGPCKMLAPRIERVVSSKGDKIHLAKVNIDDNAEIAMEYGVSSAFFRFLPNCSVSAVPSVLSVIDGMVKEKFVGLLDEDRIDSFVDKCIGDASK